MNRNYARALALVLKHEGGYVDHPSDPGGATNKGITRKTLAEWRGIAPSSKLPKSEVKNISDKEVADIYKARYWDAVQGDRLPDGVDYAVFDFAVNSGPSRAVKYLQHIVGETEDGRVGALTLDSVSKMPANEIITRLCARRMSFLRQLKTFPTFGKGWTRRVADVETDALAMATQAPVSAPKGKPAPKAPEKAPPVSGGLLGAFLAMLKLLAMVFVPKGNGK